jgi:hypothetical protein
MDETEKIVPPTDAAHRFMTAHLEVMVENDRQPSSREMLNIIRDLALIGIADQLERIADALEER